MRVKIRKYDGGGGFVSPSYIVNTPSTPAPTMSGRSQYQQKPTDAIVTEDMYRELMTKGGLTSDINSLVSELANVDLTPSNMMDPSNPMSGMGGMANISKVVKIIGKINEAKNNKEMWDASVNASRNNGSYSEVAVSGNGDLFYKDENGRLGTTTIQDYKKDPEKYSNLMSVADLLLERQKNNGLAFDTNVFDIAQNSVGLEKITDHIQGLFKTLSDYSTSTERHYTKEDAQKEYDRQYQIIQQAGRLPTAEERSGLASLKEKLNTPGDYFKDDEKSSRKGRDLGAAFKYILGTLGQAERKKLDVVATMNGTSTPEMIENMLMNYSGSNTESKVSPEKQSTIMDVEPKVAQKSLTTFQMFHNDKLATPGMSFAFNDPAVSTMFRGLVTGVSPLITADGQPLGYSTIGEVLKSGYSNFLEGDNVYLGDKKVNPALMNTIIYAPSDAAKIYMPVNKDGSVDYKSLNEFKELYTLYDAKKDNMSAAEATAMFRKHGFNITIDDKIDGGKITKVIRDNDQVKPFLTFFGYTNDANGLTDDNTGVKKLSDDETHTIMPMLTAKWTIGTGKNAINITPDRSWHTEKYFKGLVTIPYRAGSNEIVDAMVDQGPLSSVSTYANDYKHLQYSSNRPFTGNVSAAALNAPN